MLRGIQLLEESRLPLAHHIHVASITVFVDFDLAKIYGYSTKAFNQQVKNNSERFASDFAFKLTKEEVNNLRSKNLTSSWGGSRYLPNAFTEQGIYMHT